MRTPLDLRLSRRAYVIGVLIALAGVSFPLPWMLLMLLVPRPLLVYAPMAMSVGACIVAAVLMYGRLRDAGRPGWWAPVAALLGSGAAWGLNWCVMSAYFPRDPKLEPLMLPALIASTAVLIAAGIVFPIAIATWRTRPSGT